MPPLGVRLFLLWIIAISPGWAQLAVLSGTISNINGPVPRVAVRARAVASGKVFDASTSAKGTYSLRLPAGSYDLFATVVGHGAFTQRGIALKAGEQRVINSTLTMSGNEGTPGELTFLHLGDERVAPTGPAPKLGNVPDLSGVWYASPDLEPETIPFQPWAAEYAHTHGRQRPARLLPAFRRRPCESE